MEQSITSEIDSIDKEIEALQKRKSQLQSSAGADETKSLDLDKLIESANAQLIAVLDNDRLSFTASKEGRVFEGGHIYASSLQFRHTIKCNQTYREHDQCRQIHNTYSC